MLTGREFFFLELNARIQVEHPVTEAVTGLDLVEQQLRIAEGRELGDPPAGPTGHAVEVRLYAEDPSDDWAPSTGTIRRFDVPQTAGIRVDSAVESGSTVGIHYDAMIAKIVAFGADRTEALRKLDGALRGARVHGLVTNVDLLRSIITDDDFVAERLSTALLDDRLAEWTAPRHDERSVR
jgi:propionyl-CoA carboxylase alpha chain